MGRCQRVLLLLSIAVPLRADTVYQINAQGRQVVLQRDAIVIQEDSSFLVYKHFELKERRVEKVRLNKGSLPYVVTPGSPAQQKQIVDKWKRFGYTATVTDFSGKTTQVYDAYIDFYPPGGRGSLLESVPPRTSIALILDGGGADELDFSKIAQVEFQGEHLKITSRDGQGESGRFLMPTERPAEARFLGITDQYKPASQDVFDFSLPLGKVKAITFQ